MFSYRHSLNGREAAAHLQGWTSTQVQPNVMRRCILISVLFPSVPTFCPRAGRTAARSQVGR